MSTHNSTLVVNAFSTSPSASSSGFEDTALGVGGVLSVGGANYSGTDGPDCVRVQTGDVISWNPGNVRDYTGTGFEICYKDAANGGGVLLTGGRAEFRNCSFRQNFATRNGGGIFIDGGSASLEIVSVEDNGASAGGAIYYTSGTFSAAGLILEPVDDVGGEFSFF